MAPTVEDIRGKQPQDPDLTVHVTGAVVVPGVVDVPLGSRVADVVAAAGGANPGADLDAVNLAAPVHDGDHVSIPQVGEDAPSATDGIGVAKPDDGLIHINSAGPEQLAELPGVGPVLADRIIAHRDQTGRFETVEDLLDVPGIGEVRLAGMRDLIGLP